MDSYYDVNELKTLGIRFTRGGNSVRISRKCSIYTDELIIHGENVRIDDFCFLSGHIEIGNYVHIAPYSLLNGNGGGIYIEDFVNIGSRVNIYTTSDDFSGNMMTGPLIPDDCKRVLAGAVHIRRHCIIGTASVVLQGVDLKEGNAYGAMSLIKSDTYPFGVSVGIPTKRIRERSRNLLSYENEVDSDELCNSGKGDPVVHKVT